MNKKLMIILIFVSVALTIIGIATWNVMRSGENLEEHTVITVNGETSKTLKAALSDFYPGNTQEYSISLEGGSVENYYVTLNFRNDEKSGSLVEFLTVKISTKEFTTEKTLKELLDGDGVMLGQNANEIKISYTMSENVGNEAQGTTALFYIDLMVKNSDK